MLFVYVTARAYHRPTVLLSWLALIHILADWTFEVWSFLLRGRSQGKRSPACGAPWGSRLDESVRVLAGYAIPFGRLS